MQHLLRRLPFGFPRRALGREQPLGVRVVNPGVLLQAMPEEQTATRGLHEPRIDDDAMQPVVRVDRPQERDALGRRALGQLQPFGHRQHARVPALARHDGEVCGVAPVAEHEVGVGERDVLGDTLHRIVGVVERLDGPVGVGIAVAVERESLPPSCRRRLRRR